MIRGSSATFLSFTIPFCLLCVMACKPSHTYFNNNVPPVAEKPDPTPKTDSKEPVTKVEMTMSQLVAEPEFIDFSHISKFILKNHCMECHDSMNRKDGVDVSTFDSLLMGNSKKLVYPQEPERSPLYNTLIVAPSAARHMPPSNKKQLSMEQQDLIYHWIRLGAQEMAPEPPPTDVVNPEPTPVKTPLPKVKSIKQVLQPYLDKPETIDFSVVNKHVIQPLCIKCHSQNSTHKHKKDALYSADMTNYQALFDPFAPVVKIGNHQRSKMFKAAAINQTMPPPRDGYDPVDPYLVKLMRLWIVNCAIEDYSKHKGETLLKDPSGIKVRLCEGQ